ncbi:MULTISPECIES: hypothetical protein [unclassified Streptomyces]|uniref:LPXTG cell wall anchor domain-containing protein n=1 Tax=Streptomyces sp. NBC_00060 TaxID=2975636 RepID=A0AAU2GRB7_9ACTN
MAGRMALGVGMTTLTGAALLLSSGASAMAAETQPATGTVAAQSADQKPDSAAADLAWGTTYVKKVAALKKQVRELPDLDPEFDKRIKELDAQIKAQSKEAEGRIGALSKRLSSLEQQVQQLKDASAKKGGAILADAKKKFAPLAGHRLQEDKFGAEWEAAVKAVRAVDDLVNSAGKGKDDNHGKDDKSKDGRRDDEPRSKSDKGGDKAKAGDKAKDGGKEDSSLTGTSGTGRTGRSSSTGGTGFPSADGGPTTSDGSSKLGIAAGNGGATETSDSSALWVSSGAVLALLGGAGTTYAVRRRAKH